MPRFRSRRVDRFSSASKLVRLAVEPLESRRLLAVVLNGTVLEITGDTDLPGQDDTIVVTRESADPSNIEVVLNGVSSFFPLANVTQINASGLGGRDSFRLDSSRGLINVAAGIRFDGGTGTDTVSLAQTGGDTQTSSTYAVGPVAGQGASVLTGPSGTQSLTFQNIEPLVDVVPAASLTITGTPEANSITYTFDQVTSRGFVTIDNQESVAFANKTAVTIQGGAGDDTFSVNSTGTPTGLTGLTIAGQDGSDKITIRGTGAVPITVNGGIGNEIIDAAGTLANLTLQGEDDNDTITGGSASDTLLGGAGDDLIIASPGNDSINGGGGDDQFLIQGTTGNDTLTLFQSAANTLQATLNGSNRSYTISAIQLIRAETLAGDDSILVRASETVSNTDSIALHVDGGPPSAGDRLVVNDEGPNGVQVIYRKGQDDNSGTINFGVLKPISFENVTTTKITPLDPIAGKILANGNLILFKHDPFENNDSIATATYLGSGATINVDPTIDPPGFSFHVGDVENPEIITVPGDQDWYRFTAEKTGTLSFQVYFKTLASLPGQGNLNVEIYDGEGSAVAIGAGTVLNDGAGNPIGKQIVIPVIKEQTYYMRVLGATAESTNVYNFTVINDPIPTPNVVDLQEGADSGRSNVDDITNIPLAKFDVYLDDADLRALTNLGLTPDTVDNNAPDGDYGVQVFNNDVFLGYAVYRGPVPPGSPNIGNNRWEFTAAAGQLQEGDNNLITAAVWIRDRATPAQLNRGELSPALQIELDTTPPATPTIALDPATTDSGVTGQPNTFADRITNVTAPGFVGRAEADSIVRLWADGVPVSNGIINGSDVFEGLTTAVPLDGNNAFPNGQWRLAVKVDLNDPTAGFPPDGWRQMTATAEDVAGNESSRNEPAVLNIFLDTQGPQLYTPAGSSAAVTITGSPAFNLFEPKPNSGPTPRVDGLTINIQDLPNRDTTLFPNYRALVESIAANPGHYLLKGDASGVIAISAVTVVFGPDVNGQPATAQIFLNFAAPLPDDRFTLTISDSLVDPAGNHLDGESNAIQPVGTPTATSGDGVPGGSFVARFTVDSRPELGVFSDGSVYLDTNGNYFFDPTNVDATNRDLVYVHGFATDELFAGKLHVGGAAVNDNFDKVGAYGFANGAWRWSLDTNNDGVPDYNVVNPIPIDGMPFAGNFDGNAANGDEVGVFDGATWWLDKNGDGVISNADVALGGKLTGNMRGYPIVGDFDGDGFDDLATWTANRFQFNLAALGLTGNANYTRSFGFSGVLERPLAGDMNLDGIDDLALWVPGRTGQSSNPSEIYFLLSKETRAEAAPGTIDAFDFSFSPTPLGIDLFAKFGDPFGLPLLGNFDPPIMAASAPALARLSGTVFIDANHNGLPDPGETKPNVDVQVKGANHVYSVKTDAAGNYALDLPAGPYTITAWGNTLSAVLRKENVVVSGVGSSVLLFLVPDPNAPEASNTPDPNEGMDVNGDGMVSPSDVLRLINAINQAAAQGRSVAYATNMDVNTDGMISPSDVLRLINYINAHNTTATAKTAAKAAALPTASPSLAASASVATSSSTAGGPSQQDLQAIALDAAIRAATDPSSEVLIDVTKRKRT